MNEGTGARGEFLAPEAAYRADRLVALALAVGVLGFWGVSLLLRRPPAMGGFDPGTAVLAGVAVMLGAAAVALVLRSQVVRDVEDASRAADAERPWLPRLRSRLLVSWAVLEAGALLCGVIHFMTGAAEVLGYAAPIWLAGVGLTFPRAEWYGRAPDGRPLR